MTANDYLTAIISAMLVLMVAGIVYAWLMPQAPAQPRRNHRHTVQPSTEYDMGESDQGEIGGLMFAGDHSAVSSNETWCY